MESNPNLKSIYNITKELQEIMLNRSSTPELPVLSMPELSKKIHGIHKRKMTIIGARTSHAKTSFALQIAFDIAKQNKVVLFLSLEMDKADMLERLFCNSKRIDNYDLLRGRFSDYKTEWYEFIEEVKSVPLIFSDCMGKNWQDINNIISNTRVKPDMVILDYVQAVMGDGRTQKDKIDDYVLNFRKMAIEHNYAGILCSQVNRSNENDKNKFPQLHQLKGSGVLEEHADIIVLLYYEYKHTEDESQKNKFCFSVAKNRNGRTGSVNIKFTPEYYLFEDISDGIENVVFEE